ncbi:hypothetical protein F8S09_01715 [Deinococcus sp. SDU3-2]|uniref:Uncharacterized protein n=1 Tax=Deinococcus terrestris TaxID=2651870 RepID=A0A7X1TQ92_9DEIO|nr:hypothetical protein [Deinococcus terrestris]MPY65410.1 hypothetical protein [Deinococcus terrestris]
MKDAGLWALQTLRWRRGARRTWESWRTSGLLLMGAYLGAALLVGLVSLWQTSRVPLAAPDPVVVGALMAAWWGSAALVRRPVLTLSPTDALLLRTPAPPWQAWLGPLLARLGPALLQSLALGLLLWAWFPTWWVVAVSLPLLSIGRLLAQALWYDSGVSGDRVVRARLVGLFLLPLLGGLHPAVLPLSLLVGVLILGRLWRGFWSGDVPATLVVHAQVEDLRRGARRLGLPVPDVRPDGTRAPRRWTWPLRGTGAFQASLWRSGLHLTRTPGLLLLALPLGVLAASLSPTLGLDPMLTRAAPLLFGQMLAPLLVVLGPVVPATLPLPGWQGRLARVLPAGVTLGLLLGLGALGATWMGWGSAGLVLSALLMPGVALTLLAWLGQAGPASLSGNGRLRFAAGTAPALLTVLLGGTLGGWLVPAGLLVLGGVVLLLPGGS